jgi:phospholipid/cholesterol/gamma-HCH transport system substrate-binding protein
MKNTLETRLGVFFALALIAAVIIMEMIGSFEFFKRGVRVRALFNTVQELNVGDPVKMGGKRVGRVDAIEFRGDKVEVRMKLEDTQRVKTDSKASIHFSGLLGQNFVALSFGTPAARAVENGTLLDTKDVPDLGTLMVELEEVAKGVKNVTASFSGDTIQNLVAPLVDTVKDNGPRLSGILSNVQTISAQVASGQGSIGRLLFEDTFHDAALATVTNLNATATDVQGAIDQAKTILARVQEGQGTIGKLTTDDALYREFTTAATNLSEILQKINRGQGTIGKVVNDDTFYKNARLSLQKLDKATESLEDQGPLTVLGIAVGKLF